MPATKTKKAKRTTKKTAAKTTVAPTLATVEDEHKAELAVNMAHAGVMSQAMLSQHLGEGVDTDLVGGSVPLLEFKRPGDSRLMIYEGREVREDSDYDFILWTVLDPTRFSAIDPRSASMGKGQLICSHAFDKWSEETAKVGDVVIVTYGGDIPTKKGLNKLKLFTINAVREGGKPLRAPAK